MSRDDKRQRIMAAAEALFTAGGLASVTLDQVAARAHVGKGTLYLYFHNKEDLFFQTAMAGVDDLCRIIAASAPKGSSFDRRLLLACRHLNRFYTRRQTLIRMFIAQAEQLTAEGQGLYRRGLAKRRQLAQVLAEILQQGVSEGRVRKDLPPQVLAEFLLGMLRTRNRDLPGRHARYRSDRSVVDLFVHVPPPLPARRNGPAVLST